MLDKLIRENDKIYKTDEISEYLIHEKELKLGLLGGDLAWCIYLNETECANKELYLDKILEKTINNLNQVQTPLSFNIHNGIGSLYVTMNYLNKRDILYSSDYTKLEKKILSVYEFLLEQNNFDLLYGCTGLAIGFIHSGVDLMMVAEQYINKIYEIYNHNKSISICLPNSDVINFGLAHGVCSTAMLLIEFLSKGVCDPRITDLLISAGNTLVDLLRTKSNGATVIPTSLEKGKILSKVEVLGWCTGRLSYGITLLNIYKATGVEVYKRVGQQILEEALDIYSPPNIELKDDNFKVIAENLCLCHGMSSSSLLFKIAHEKTGNERFIKISEDIKDDIINIFNQDKNLIFDYKNNLSLLSGLSGILLSISNNNSNLWRKLILL